MYFKCSNFLAHPIGEFIDVCNFNKYLVSRVIYNSDTLFEFDEYTFLASDFENKMNLKEISKKEFIEIGKSLINKELDILKDCELYETGIDCILARKDSTYRYYEITNDEISRTILNQSHALTIIKYECDKDSTLEWLYRQYNKWLFRSV